MAVLTSAINYRLSSQATLRGGSTGPPFAVAFSRKGKRRFMRPSAPQRDRDTMTAIRAITVAVALG